jgi:protein mago nashi
LFPVNISAAVVQEMRHIIKESEIMREDDSKWPPKNKDGMQELAIKIGKESISFQVNEEM